MDLFTKELKKLYTNNQHSGYVDSLNNHEQLSKYLDFSCKHISDCLGKSTDLVVREFYLEANKKHLAAILYIDGLADTNTVQDFIIRDLTSNTASLEKNEAAEAEEVNNLFMALKEHAISISQIKEIATYDELFASLLSGDTVLLMDGSDRGLAASTAGWEDRAVQPPQDQSVVRGPRDSFTENLRTNTALVRRRIKNPNLWLQTKIIGTISQTNVAIMYIKGIANEDVIAEVHRRLDEIQIAGIFESGTIEELIEDRTLTPFPTMYNTERPDVIAAGLMEGRVAILVDGTPFVLLVPALFIQFLQTAEDYYQRPDFGLLRLLRALSFFIALLGPSFYIAVTSFHQEMIPTPLMISIAAARDGVPFPAFIEAIIMETTFEILREAGVRMPRAVGQAVSIVGALVIGQAAVEAGLVSPGMVIVVSITAIASFTLPAYNMGVSVRMIRYPLMALAAIAGLFGIFFGIGMMLVHLCSLRSFGVLYMAPFAPFNWRDQKDSLFRLPKLGLSLKVDSFSKKQRK